MTIDDIKERFIDEVRLRGQNDGYVDLNEEREILQVAIQHGVGVQSARQALAEVCEREGFILESTQLWLIRRDVEQALADDGLVDQQEFETIITNAKRRLLGKKNDREVNKMVVKLMEGAGLNQIKAGRVGDWYMALKKRLGMN